MRNRPPYTPRIPGTTSAREGRQRWETDDLLLLARAVADGHGVALLPRRAVADTAAAVDVHPLRDLALRRRLLATARASVTARPIVAQVLDALTEAGKEESVMTGTFIASYGGKVAKIAPGQEFSFGRAPTCQICFDPDDTGISRLSGRVEFDGRTWWIVNVSSSRPLAFVDERAVRTEIAPGKRLAAEAPGKVVVQGTSTAYEISVAPPRDSGAPAQWTPPAKLARPDPSGAGTPAIAGVGITTADRAALAALFVGYVRKDEAYDPYPASYAEAAKRLGWPRRTLESRVSLLLKQLSAAGVSDLDTWNPLVNLADIVLAAGILTPDDAAAFPD